MFKKILIANRGEIACRVMRTAREMGIATVAVYSDADKNALHVAMADEAYPIGAAPSSESYLRVEKIIEVCRISGAEAVHPGYGFLSENAGFAAALAEAGIAFIGPPPKAIEAMGDKITSKKIASEAGVSTVPGFMGIIENVDEAVRIATDIGFPVMIKASAGGGGKGMRIAHSDQEVREGFEASKNEAAASFGDDRIFIEKFVTSPRHIEIQVLADSHGNCIYLGERECSIQRRNQKVIEEAPSPFLDEETRKKMGRQACDLAQAVGYQSAGTVEFIVDGDRNFYFLEMNTRLQVEHPVTELITGVDLVAEMLKIAAGQSLSITQDAVTITGWAMESRIYAEDPYRNFLPSIGRLKTYRPPEEGNVEGKTIRNDTGVYEGGEISMYYDPMIAKLCTHAPTRLEAIDHMQQALDGFIIEGVAHNIPFVNAIMSDDNFRKGDMTTGFIAETYPDGFAGKALTNDEQEALAAIAAWMYFQSETRRCAISGVQGNLSRHPAQSWQIKVEDKMIGAELVPGSSRDVKLSNSKQFRISGKWSPDQNLANVHANQELFVLQVKETASGFTIQTRGAKVNIGVYTTEVAALLPIMKEKDSAALMNVLLCPMPGLVVRILVEEGDQVQAGQMLCVVEAMKMENILRAEQAGKVKKIFVQAGDVVPVDDEIMEFE